jgi:hypothetical protein
MPTIVVEDVRKVYGLVAAVDGLSFSAAEAVNTSNVKCRRRGLPVEFEPLQP